LSKRSLVFLKYVYNEAIGFTVAVFVSPWVHVRNQLFYQHVLNCVKPTKAAMTSNRLDGTIFETPICIAILSSPI